MLHISVVLDESLAGGYHCVFRAVDYPEPGESPDTLLVTSSWEEIPHEVRGDDTLDQALEVISRYAGSLRRRPF